MNLNQAFDQSLKDYGVSAKLLSEKSGVSERMISQFRNSRQRIYSDTLEKLLLALSFEVRLHFLSLVLGVEITPEKLVVGMKEAELSSLLNAIADKLCPKNQNSDISLKEKIAS